MNKNTYCILGLRKLYFFQAPFKDPVFKLLVIKRSGSRSKQVEAQRKHCLLRNQQIYIPLQLLRCIRFIWLKLDIIKHIIMVFGHLILMLRPYTPSNREEHLQVIFISNYANFFRSKIQRVLNGSQYQALLSDKSS